MPADEKREKLRSQVAVDTDETTFSALFERHRRELQAHCYRMVGSFEDSEDLVQETFARAWRARARFGREGQWSFRAWLYRIATNACLDHVARRGPRVLAVDVASAADPDGDVPAIATDVRWLEPYPDRMVDPHEAAVARETLEKRSSRVQDCRRGVDCADPARRGRVLGARDFEAVRHERHECQQRAAARARSAARVPAVAAREWPRSERAAEQRESPGATSRRSSAGTSRRWPRSSERRRCSRSRRARSGTTDSTRSGAAARSTPRHGSTCSWRRGGTCSRRWRSTCERTSRHATVSSCS